METLIRWLVVLLVILGFASWAWGAEPTASTAAASALPATPEAAENMAEYLFDLEEDLGHLKIFAASQQEEPLREVPVPVTVITREMMAAIGARSLQDVLVTYVPGVTLAADHNEVNVAMRGVYASSQQKILVLLDGHRLNSRAYSMANPDFSIGLDKLERIEVLRGPGSSLYGGIALTAVINLVSRRPDSVDGAQVRLGGGNYGQRTASFLFGKDLGKVGVFAWASGYAADGEKVAVPAASDFALVPRDGAALVGAVRDPFNYDLGLKLSTGDFSLLASRRFGKIVEPFTSAGVTGETYDYGAYRTLLTTGPGLGSRSNHLELKWNRSLSERLQLTASVSYDTNEMLAVLTQDPVALSATFLSWDEDAVGATVQGRYNYEAGRAGAGNLTLGAQFERMQLLDSAGPRANGGVWGGFGTDPSVFLLEKGVEETASGFAQLKHRLSDFIFNVGLRYDENFRHRAPNARVGSLSPRLAVVYAPAETWDLKLSYARSFVDAPYWYRYNSLPSYRGADTLTPEHLQTIQLTPTVKLFDGKVTNTLNLFYQHLTDFVFRNNAAGPSEPLYQNAGMLKSVGAEEEVAVLREAWHLRANVAWQRLLEAKDFGGYDSEINNVPAFTGALVADVNPIPRIYERLWLNATARYVGPQRAPITSRFVDSAGTVVADYTDANHRLPGVMLFNLGVRLPDLVVPGLALDATVYNLLGTHYEQGGSTNFSYPQPGRWVLLNLGYRLPL